MSNKRIIWGLVALLTLPFFYNAPWVSNVRAEAEATVEALYPGLASGVLRSAKMVDMEKGLLLLSDDIEIRENFTEGKEVFRHQGFYAEAEVLKQLKKMGVE